MKGDNKTSTLLIDVKHDIVQNAARIKSSSSWESFLNSI